LKVTRSFGGTRRLYFQDGRIRQARNKYERIWQAKALKMETIFSSETPAEFQQTTRRYIPEGKTFHDHNYEDFKSCIVHYFFILSSVCVVVSFLNGSPLVYFMQFYVYYNYIRLPHNINS
jgi:hypothetical protein